MGLIKQILTSESDSTSMFKVIVSCWCRLTERSGSVLSEALAHLSHPVCCCHCRHCGHRPQQFALPGAQFSSCWLPHCVGHCLHVCPRPAPPCYAVGRENSAVADCRAQSVLRLTKLYRNAGPCTCSLSVVHLNCKLFAYSCVPTALNHSGGIAGFAVLVVAGASTFAIFGPAISW